MNAKILTMFVSGGLLSLSCHAQGTFQNLGFENTTIPLGTPPSTPQTPASFAAAFPGWTGTINGGFQGNAIYNNLALGISAFALLGPDSPIGNTVDGNYTAVLQAHSISDLPSEISLFQSGTISSDTRSLRFLGTTPLGLFQGQLTVSLNGTPLSLSVLQDFGTNALYAADVSPFAGQSAELRFTDSVGAFGNSNFFLDAISFSPNAVPEPSTWALLSLGSALFWCVALRRRMAP